MGTQKKDPEARFWRRVVIMLEPFQLLWLVPLRRWQSGPPICEASSFVRGGERKVVSFSCMKNVSQPIQFSVNRRKDGDDILKRRKGALFSKPLLVLLSTSATRWTPTICLNINSIICLWRRSGVEFNDGLQWIMASSEKTVSERTAQIEISDFQCLIYHCWKNVPSVNV